VEVDAGTLVIQPLSVSQLREVTDLLTDVFEASEDAVGLYTRWMRGQIRQYLEHHIKVGTLLVPVTACQHRRVQITCYMRVLHICNPLEAFVDQSVDLVSGVSMPVVRVGDNWI
jgi:hypothetical protein